MTNALYIFGGLLIAIALGMLVGIFGPLNPTCVLNSFWFLNTLCPSWAVFFASPLFIVGGVLVYRGSQVDE